MKRILACIDASGYATSVCDLAAWAAARLPAAIDLLHVVQRKDSAAAHHDLSGAIGLGVKTDLLEELTRIDEAQSRLEIERGRLLLDSAAQRLSAARVTEMRALHRHGGIVETILEQEETANLVVIGKRGASSAFATDHIGSKIERVVRASTKPVLIASRQIPEIGSVVVAYDGSAAARKAVRLVATSPLLAGLDVHVVMAGSDEAANRQRLEQAALSFEGSDIMPTLHLASGRAEEVIGEYMAARPSAMLVMGAYGHSPLRTLIVGSTTTVMVRTVRAPVLLIR